MQSLRLCGPAGLLTWKRRSTCRSQALSILARLAWGRPPRTIIRYPKLPGSAASVSAEADGMPRLKWSTQRICRWWKCHLKDIDGKTKFMAWLVSLRPSPSWDPPPWSTASIRDAAPDPIWSRNSGWQRCDRSRSAVWREARRGEGANSVLRLCDSNRPAEGPSPPLKAKLVLTYLVTSLESASFLNWIYFWIQS